MAIPWHTFAPTGDPLVDDPDFRPKKTNINTCSHWFKSNPHVLRYTAEDVIRDAEPYKPGAGGKGWGIYALLHDGEIAYVGKAREIRSRLRSHLSQKFFTDYWCLGGMPYEYLPDAERYYIRRLRPYLNMQYVQGGPGPLPLEKIAQADDFAMSMRCGEFPFYAP